MPGQMPDIVKIYRIAHISNIEYILTHGMFTWNNIKADPSYINIGDSDLITKRNVYSVKINPPNGLLGDYVPFYFGPLSPMLLKIKDGNAGIKRRPQSEIVYIICQVDEVIEHCQHWCFTNGHAKTAISDFYNHTSHLNEVDWDMVGQRYWRNTEDDFDRMRRKQAEFLVKDHVPVACIKEIVTFNTYSKAVIENIINKLMLDITVKINPNNNFYY
jgi:ssDNA thymidine ADP-ribosyltransferase, DarT